MRYLPEGRGRGSRTWMVEVLSLMSRRMSRTPYGAYLRASGVMMFFSSKEVLSHRWKALFATQASKMSRQRMMAKSPLGPPRFW